MKIKITENTRVDGNGVKIGDKVDTSEKNAKYLVAIGKAEYVTKPAKEKGGLTTKNSGGLVA